MTGEITFDELLKRSTEIVQLMDKKRGVAHDNQLTVVHLAEELGEVARQVFNESSKRNALDKENMAEEIVDCLILLSHLANINNLDVKKAFEKKLAVLRERAQKL